MQEHPLLMNGPLVRATLAGLKTQTRRPIKSQGLGYSSSWAARCPLGQAGDRLWVRETWRPVMETWSSFVEYGAGGELSTTGHADAMTAMTKLTKVALRFPGGREDIHSEQWHPSIHMPRWACRLVLPLVSVRVERVQDITEEDAKAEGLRRTENGWSDGATGYDVTSARAAFRELWASIYGEGTWDANPWVWVAEWDHVEVRK